MAVHERWAQESWNPIHSIQSLETIGSRRSLAIPGHKDRHGGEDKEHQKFHRPEAKIAAMTVAPERSLGGHPSSELRSRGYRSRAEKPNDQPSGEPGE